MFKKTRKFLCIILLLTILFPHGIFAPAQTFDIIEKEKLN